MPAPRAIQSQSLFLPLRNLSVLPQVTCNWVRLAAGLLAAVALYACSAADDQDVSPFQGTAIGISTADIDTAIDPGNDFYRYANGNWLAAAQIPEGSDYIARQSRAQAELDRRLTTIVEDIAGRPQDAGTPEAVVRDYYRSFMDRAAINRQGISPVVGDIKRFQSVGDIGMLSEVIGGTLRADFNPLLAPEDGTGNLFAVAAMPAPDDGRTVAWLFTGGLGLPDRATYLAQSRAAQADRAAYRDLVARTLSLAGLDDATARADAVLALEVKLAEAQGPVLQGRALLETATVWSSEELAANAPGLDWERLLVAAGLQDADRIALFQPAAMTALSALTTSEPIEAWRDWLVFHRLNDHAAVLPEDFGSAHAAFYQRRLKGRLRIAPLEEQVVDRIGALFGETMSRLYAERYFSEEEQRDIEIIAERVREALIAWIASDGALGEGTKAQAIAKLEALKTGIGYPETYREIAQLKAVGNNAYARTVAAERAAYAREIASIGGSGKALRWRIGSHRMFAAYLPLENGIIVPAAILQPPFYDPEADAAANYGAIGTIIGREMSRAVDPAGAMVDDGSRIADWLTGEDPQALDRRADALARQIGDYRAFSDLPIDGQTATSGNAADLAGLTAAYDAYRASLGGREPRVIEGFTGDQRFFIAFAQLWASRLNENYTRRLVAHGTTILPRFRVAGVRNVDAWYRAFDVQENDALYLSPEERAAIW